MNRLGPSPSLILDVVAVGGVSADMTYRLGWVSYWICLVLAGTWAVFFCLLHTLVSQSR
jgi:hypothetical protein